MGLMCDCVDHVSRMYNPILDVSVSQDQGRSDTGSHTILGIDTVPKSMYLWYRKCQYRKIIGKEENINP